ncbi:MAG: hypothetical protein GY739_12505 [Mesoflavibacter sp.]|nr:hypothetical protein [Mesoflavibacter sp.]
MNKKIIITIIICLKTIRPSEIIPRAENHYEVYENLEHNYKDWKAVKVEILGFKEIKKLVPDFGQNSLSSLLMGRNERQIKWNKILADIKEIEQQLIIPTEMEDRITNCKISNFQDTLVYITHKNQDTTNKRRKRSTPTQLKFKHKSILELRKMLKRFGEEEMDIINHRQIKVNLDKFILSQDQQERQECFHKLKNSLRCLSNEKKLKIMRYVSYELIEGTIMDTKNQLITILKGNKATIESQIRIIVRTKFRYRTTEFNTDRPEDPNLCPADISDIELSGNYNLDDTNENELEQENVNQNNITPEQNNGNQNNITPEQSNENQNNITPEQSNGNQNNIPPEQSNENQNNISPEQSNENQNNIITEQSNENQNSITPEQSNINQNNIISEQNNENQIDGQNDENENNIIVEQNNNNQNNLEQNSRNQNNIITEEYNENSNNINPGQNDEEQNNFENQIENNNQIIENSNNQQNNNLNNQNINNELDNEISEQYELPILNQEQELDVQLRNLLRNNNQNTFNIEEHTRKMILNLINNRNEQNSDITNSELISEISSKLESLPNNENNEQLFEELGKLFTYIVLEQPRLETRETNNNIVYCSTPNKCTTDNVDLDLIESQLKNSFSNDELSEILDAGKASYQIYSLAFTKLTFKNNLEKVSNIQTKELLFKNKQEISQSILLNLLNDEEQSSSILETISHLIRFIKTKLMHKLTRNIIQLETKFLQDCPELNLQKAIITLNKTLISFNKDGGNSEYKEPIHFCYEKTCNRLISRKYVIDKDGDRCMLSKINKNNFCIYQYPEIDNQNDCEENIQPNNDCEYQKIKFKANTNLGNNTNYICKLGNIGCNFYKNGKIIKKSFISHETYLSNFHKETNFLDALNPTKITVVLITTVLTAIISMMILNIIYESGKLIKNRCCNKQQESIYTDVPLEELQLQNYRQEHTNPFYRQRTIGYNPNMP